MEFIAGFIKSAQHIFPRIRKILLPRIKFLSSKRKYYYKKFIARAQRHPIMTFFGLLLILLGLIIISSFINRPREASEIGLPTKEVQVYTIGTSPKIIVQAQVEKSGVVKVVALGSGVIQYINVQVG